MHLSVIRVYRSISLCIVMSHPSDSVEHGESDVCSLVKKTCINGLEVSRTPKGLPEQLAIALTYQCKLILIPY